MPNLESNTGRTRRVGAVAALILAVALAWKTIFVTVVLPASGAIQLVMLALLAWCSRDLFRGVGDGRARPPILAIAMALLACVGIFFLLFLGTGTFQSRLSILYTTTSFVLASAAILLVGWIGLVIGCFRQSRLSAETRWRGIGILYLVGVVCLVTAFVIAIASAGNLPESNYAYYFAIFGALGASSGIAGASLLILGLLGHAWALIAPPDAGALETRPNAAK